MSRDTGDLEFDLGYIFSHKSLNTASTTSYKPKYCMGISKVKARSKSPGSCDPSTRVFQGISSCKRVMVSYTTDLDLW